MNLTISTNQLNRKINRLQNYDYSQSGWYFVTTCTKDMQHFFGEVKNNEMVLNEYGKIIRNQWLWLKEQYDCVQLDEYVVMPNHMHGILIIKTDESCRDNPRVVHVQIASKTTIYNRRYNLLSKTINAFKTTSSKIIHQNGLEHFAWQRSFYDHVIRDEQSLNGIREYITNNPLKWAIECKNKENLYY